MTRSLAVLLLAGLASLAAPAAVGQAQEQVLSLDELLRQVEQGRAGDAREFKEREQRFLAARAEQRQLLNEAVARKAREEARSEQLETTFEENEIRASELTEALDRRLGSLKELFGVLQQVSGDTQAVLQSSLTSVQYPDRGAALAELADKMGTSTQLASIEEIENLWYELQREMVEQGKVVRFPATVITTDGHSDQRDVVRVGVFNIVSEGKYLQYVPETGNLVELPRQPQQKRFVETTSAISAAGDGQVNFGLDPTRGQILSLLIQAPDLRERINQGGIVGYIIIALGFVALLIALERLIVLGLTGRRVSAQLSESQPDENNPLGRVLIAAARQKDASIETLELKLDEAILKEMPSLQRALLFLKIIAVVAPLLGLLGTVTGMIQTFQVITLFGTGDPKLMAGGISQALVTTVLGLTVAIPTVLLHTLVTGRSRRISNVLQQQAAGIVAERSESEPDTGIRGATPV
jgi:biopolymer transport protein ExbB